MTSLDWFCILAGFAVGSFIAATPHSDRTILLQQLWDEAYLVFARTDYFFCQSGGEVPVLPVSNTT